MFMIINLEGPGIIPDFFVLRLRVGKDLFCYNE